MPGSSPFMGLACADRIPYAQRLIVNRPWNKCDLQNYQIYSTLLQILTHWFQGRAKKIKVYWGNTTASEVKLSEATVDSFDVRQFDPADDFRIPITSATSFLLNDKVNNHSDLKEIIETFGEPQTIHYLFGWDSSTIVIAYDGYYCSAPEFYLSPDGKILYELQVS